MITIIDRFYMKTLLKYLDNKTTTAYALCNKERKNRILPLLARCISCKLKGHLCIKEHCRMDTCTPHKVCISTGFKLLMSCPQLLTSSGIVTNKSIKEYIGCNTQGFCSGCQSFKGRWHGMRGVTFDSRLCMICGAAVCDNCACSCARDLCTRIVCQKCLLNCTKCDNKYCSHCFLPSGLLNDDSHKCHVIKVTFDGLNQVFGL